MLLTTILSADLWFENLMLSVRNPFLVQIFKRITFFGNTTTVIGIAVLIGAYLFFSKVLRPYLAGLFVTLGGAATSAYFLKEIVGRARPGGLISTAIESDFSFPSGHATASMALYGFTAYILCRLYPQHRRAVLGVATSLILLIGFSRLYLGLHFPTDVIVGYLVGGVWLWIGIKLVQKLQIPR
jgi:undecaprenyl-diphosphatase